MVSARKARLSQMAEEGSRSARTALDLLESPNQLLSTVQVGISLVGVFSGALGGATLSKDLGRVIAQIPALALYSETIALVVVSLAITYFSLVIGELIPKRLALTNPERISTTMAQFMKVLSKLASPIIFILSRSTDAGIRLLGVHPSEEPPVTEEEVKVLMRQGTTVGIFQETEQDIVESVFRMSDRTVDAMMTPRTEIEWLDLDEPLETSVKIIEETHHVVYPVAAGSLDNIQGILSTRDLLREVLLEHKIDLNLLTRPPLFFPESTPALRALEELRRTGNTTAIVIDEYGGVLGMVTLSDILRSLVGNLHIEGEGSDNQIVQRADGSWLLDGLLRIDEMKDLFNLRELPDEERVGYQTLAGLVLSQIGTIPETGQTFEWQDLRFEVIDMDGLRIDKVLVTRLPQTSDSDSASS